MPTLADIQRPIAENIRDYEAHLTSMMQSENSFVRTICDYVLKNRGKQMRPLLVLLSAALHGTVNAQSYTGAALVEMIHTASLIHDDVVDGARVRRGMPAVHEVWNTRTAVLVGDYIFAHTYYISMQLGGQDMLGEITHAVHEVSVGELLQTEQSETLAITRPLYLDIIAKKTGALIGACGAIGAISVNAPTEEVNTMRAFGDNLGIAFQIKDDILDFHSETKTGKTSGSDLRERKITLPLIYLLEKSPEKERVKLLEKLRDAENNPACVEFLQRAVRENGGLEHAEAAMREFRDKAVGLLADYPDSDIKRSLALFADFVLERDM